MKKRSPLIILVLLFSAILSLSCSKKQPGLDGNTNLSASALVEEAVDGDTVRIKGGRLIRYIGIDAPELRKKIDGKWIYDPHPFSKESYEMNRRLVEGKSVRLEYDKEKTDKYNRSLAYVYAGDIFVNGELVRMGLAKVSIYPPNTRYTDLLASLEKEARKAKRGIWGME